MTNFVQILNNSPIQYLVLFLKFKFTFNFDVLISHNILQTGNIAFQQFLPTLIEYQFLF